MFLIKCKECGISKRFGRFWSEGKKVCFECKLNDSSEKEKNKINRMLRRQARFYDWKVRTCLACNLKFESVNNIFKCPYCTEKHNNLLDWNGR